MVWATDLVLFDRFHIFFNSMIGAVVTACTQMLVQGWFKLCNSNVDELLDHLDVEMNENCCERVVKVLFEAGESIDI